jgi:RNA polymerase sigma-70 factor (ECF subfamily)
MDASDPELMRRLAGGDDLALNVLMDRWSTRVAAFLHRMTGNRDTAVDLAQETFVKLYQARCRYRPSGNFSTYLFAIASNLARNHARWIARHPTLSTDAMPDDGGTVPELRDAARTPGEAVEAREKARAIQRAFQCLPPDLREAMTLFVYEGMGYAEIAAVALCSPKAVETRIYRARQLLREELKELAS